MKTLKQRSPHVNKGSKSTSSARLTKPDAFANIGTSADSGMKQCSKCKEVKPFNEFFKNRRKKDGLRSWCKSCSTAVDLARRHSLEGKSKTLYIDQHNNAKSREMPHPNYTYEEFFVWLMNNGYWKLHKDWVESDYERDLAPSADRIENHISYMFDNLMLDTWYNNWRRGNEAREKAVISTDKITGERHYYHSVREAEKVTGIANSSVSNCCNGKAKSAGGFTWHFASKIIQVSRIINLGRKLIKQVA